MGLIGQKGKPVYKPWTVATNCSELFEALNCQKCPGPKAHNHEPCAGKNTKMSENYTDPMVRIIHKAWTKHCSTMTLAKTDKIARESKVTGSNHFGLTGTQSTAPPPPAPWPGDHSGRGATRTSMKPAATLRDNCVKHEEMKDEHDLDQIITKSKRCLKCQLTSAPAEGGDSTAETDTPASEWPIPLSPLRFWCISLSGGNNPLCRCGG